MYRVRNNVKVRVGRVRVGDSGVRNDGGFRNRVSVGNGVRFEFGVVR